jgi:dihydrofolate synthase / folylpolyglutamate synthase
MIPLDDLAAYERASHRLLGLIRGERTGTMPNLDRIGRATARLARTRALLAAFGDPQHSFPSIHVTGTSGKGSVAAMIASILTAVGYRVGLRTSPYLQVATEKLQVGSQLIKAQDLDRISAEVLDTHDKVMPGDRLGYAEAWSALSFLWLAEQQIDIAVVEVGAGGRFDATNVIDPTVSVITSVGLDHIVSLGPNLADIAWHKAGIIKPGATAVIGSVPEQALRVIEHEARRVGASLHHALFAPRPRFPVGMPGEFQSTNAEVAIAAVEALRSRGISASETDVSTGLAKARLPGRLELMPGEIEPLVWLDGAHNADKIAALAREVSLVSVGESLPVLVLGVLKSKDAAAIASGIAPLASAIVVTEPAVTGKTALPMRELAAAIRATGFSGTLHEDSDPVSALTYAEMMAAIYGSNVVATGSMYLAGQLRHRWYPDEEIVVQRTPWPTTKAVSLQTPLERSVAL